LKPVETVEITVFLVFYKYWFGSSRGRKDLGEIIAAIISKPIGVFPFHFFKHDLPPFFQE